MTNPQQQPSPVLAELLQLARDPELVAAARVHYTWLWHSSGQKLVQLRRTDAAAKSVATMDQDAGTVTVGSVQLTASDLLLLVALLLDKQASS